MIINIDFNNFLLHSFSDIENFVSISTFIINNASSKYLETDVLIQKIKYHFLKLKELQLVNLFKFRDEKYQELIKDNFLYRPHK